MTKTYVAGRQARKHVLEQLHAVARFGLLGVLSVLVLALLAGAPDSAAKSSDNYTQQGLGSLLHQTNLYPRAFVEDHKIRIYVTNEGRIWMFTAAWKPERVSAKEFAYASSTLLVSKSPKPLPDTNSGWHEVTVIRRAESDPLIHKVADRLVPAEPGHGIFARFSLGDSTLYRDANGQVRLAVLTNQPANVTIDRRYTRQGFASAAAAQLETELRAAHPGQTNFAMAIGRGSRLRIAYLDLNPAQKQAVVLYIPTKVDSQRQKGPLGHRLVGLASFLLVDNAFAFLKNPVSSSVRVANQVVNWPLTLFPRLSHPKSEIPPLTNAPGMDLAAWDRWLDCHHVPREQGSVRLLIDGDKFFPTFERRVAEAQSTVDILVCIFDVDDVAVDMADRLKQRSTNIPERVIFDRLMSRMAAKAPPATPNRPGFTPPKSIARYLRQDSEVCVRPQPNPFFTVDHTKLYLVDQRYAYIGGMNVGREYRYEWHDLMAELQGPIVASYQRQFDLKWAQQGPWGDLGLAAEALKKRGTNAAPEPNADLIELRRVYTRNFHHTIRKTELAAINRASNHVFAENPYLYSNDLINALVRARRRGVDVRVILPTENDTAAGQRSNIVIANHLREQGVRVFFYPGMTHVKALLVDGWACLGSANFDALSLRLNREDDLATSNPTFAATFRHEIFDADFARSRELQEEVTTSWHDYLSDALLNPF